MKIYENNKTKVDNYVGRKTYLTRESITCKY